MGVKRFTTTERVTFSCVGREFTLWHVAPAEEGAPLKEAPSHRALRTAFDAAGECPMVFGQVDWCVMMIVISHAHSQQEWVIAHELGHVIHQSSGGDGHDEQGANVIASALLSLQNGRSFWDTLPAVATPRTFTFEKDVNDEGIVVR